MINWPNFLSQCFNGLVLGALLALISSGLTIIYGTLGVLNLAHGAMFMLGGYAGWVAYSYTGSFIVAVIAGTIFVMIVGVVMERVIIRHFYQPSARGPASGHVRARHRLRRGGALLLRQPVQGGAAAGAAGRASRRSASCSIRLIASRCSASSRSRCWRSIVVLYRTRIGMIVRAGIEDAVMVDSLGIDVYKVFMLVFGIGAMAAGFAGIVNAPVVSIAPDVGEAILVQTFVVVVIGGVGSFPGAILGGLIAGEIISITSMFNPGYSYVMLFVAMTLVLVLRPYGLLGTAGRE